MTDSKPSPYALVGWFETPESLYHACENLRAEGYRDFDAHTPFPVHGLEHAMGLRPTKLPWIILTAGTTGLTLVLLLIWYTNIDYPLNISGKVPFSYQAYVPISFEITVLFSAFAAFLGCWGLNGLPKPYDPIFKHPSFVRASDDLFFVSVPATDPKFNAEKTRKLLEKIGAREVMEVDP